MEFLMDPSIWAGLLTLVVLEIVLGIDNLVFIAILADKLPPKQRDKARLLGLSLALIMRLGLLSLISWMVTLTKPLFTVMDFSFSGRDLIMLFGGIFLLFKATTELHERLENRDHDSGHGKGYASFWVVVTQIVILDAVFSLDAVITAVGMVNHLPVMMAAVVIAMAVMLLASKPLTRFVNQHPTVVVLCLSFLLSAQIVQTIIRLRVWWQKVSVSTFRKVTCMPRLASRSSSKCLTRLRVATLFVTSRLCRCERVLPMPSCV
ncbi:putative transport protein [Escherichia coli cloneA_i1]|nr:putative transport protein [Escherichia coli cloneA_i1]